MRAKSTPLQALTADELMTRDVVRLAEDMPLQEAARLMLKNQISGAPVVDRGGRCVGILSATDFLRLAERRTDATSPAFRALPLTCSFQRRFPVPDGGEITLCTLPLGVCPIQTSQVDPDGKERIVCTDPH